MLAISRYNMKLPITILLLVVLSLASSSMPAFTAHAAGANSARAEKLARAVTIYRDTYGVPHVFGPTDASCVFGYMYAQAEDNFWQVEDNYLCSLGRAAEVYGDSKLAQDMVNRALEIPRLAKAEYERASPKVKELCTAASDGLNYFLAK